MTWPAIMTSSPLAFSGRIDMDELKIIITGPRGSGKTLVAAWLNDLFTKSGVTSQVSPVIGSTEDPEAEIVEIQLDAKMRRKMTEITCPHDWQEGFNMMGPTRSCLRCGKWEQD